MTFVRILKLSTKRRNVIAYRNMQYRNIAIYIMITISFAQLRATIIGR